MKMRAAILAVSILVAGIGLAADGPTTTSPHQTLIVSGINLPSICMEGDLFFKLSDPQNWYDCSAANTWTIRPGPPGNDGAPGAKGDKGDTGNAGSQGIQGSPGNDGAPGPKGDAGDQGLQGIQGIKGDTGNTGSQGIQGDPGSQGIQGDPGPTIYPALGLALSTGTAWNASLTAPSGAILGTTDSQELSNKSFGSGMTWPTFNQSTSGSAAKWTTARSLAGNSTDGSADVAFSNKFVVQGTTDTGLSSAQFLGALGTGLVKNTTTTGILSIAAGSDINTAFGSQTQAYVYAAPNGSAGNPTFRAIATTDVPTLNQSTSGTAASLSAILGTALGGTNANLSATGAATYVLAQDASHVVSARALVSADIPANAANTTGSAAKWTTARNLAGNSVDGSAVVAFANKFVVQGTTDTGLSGPQFLGALATGVVKNTITTGVLSIAAGSDLNTTFGSQTANYIYAAPSGSAGNPSFRAMTTVDVPTLNQDTTGKSAKTDALNSATGIVSVSAATAPTGGYVLTATSATTATWQSNPSTSIPSITSWSTIPYYAGSSTQAYSSLTTREVQLFALPFQITVNQLSEWITVNTTAGTTKLCVYSADGATKNIDVTNTPSGTGIQNTAVSAVTLNAGLYYFVVGCATTCSHTSVSGVAETTATMFGSTTPGGKRPWHGQVTHTSGTCNATLGTVTGGTDKPLLIRIDN